MHINNTSNVIAWESWMGMKKQYECCVYSFVSKEEKRKEEEKVFGHCSSECDQFKEKLCST